MGHLGHLKQEYHDLVKRLGEGQVGLPEPEDPTAWAGWKEILEIMYEPEEAPLEARPDVLDWERATSIVKGARSHAVSYCYCRHKAEHLGERCDAPIDVCLSLDAGAEYIINRGFGRAISGEEAMGVLEDAKKAGLVQIADNVLNKPTYICNCCGCCCGQLQSINQYDLNGVNPSGFQPESDSEKCVGCSLCSKSCPVTAISMVAGRVGGKRRNALRPKLDGDRCIGCGVCAAACRKEAMWMVRGGDRRHIPVNSVERAVRMSLERGRLAHLVADQGAGKGHRFLNQVIQAMMSLPAVGRLAATEQMQSRFVRYALKNVRDPTGNSTPAS